MENNSTINKDSLVIKYPKKHKYNFLDLFYLLFLLLFIRALWWIYVLYPHMSMFGKCSFVLLGIWVMYKLFLPFINKRTYTFNQEDVVVEYKFYKKRNKKFNWVDCIGYMTYCTDREFPNNSNGIVKYGIFLKFKDNKYLKITNNNLPEELDDLLNIIKNKNIKNYTPIVKKEFLIPNPSYPYFTSLLNPFRIEERYAEKAFKV